MNSGSTTSYKDAGVDTVAGQHFVRNIRDAVRTTWNQWVFQDKAGFAGLLDISFVKEYRHPLLVSATDGVGTKLHLARLFDRHDTVGQDLVAMCANDLLATGARPLQFLDYIACGKLDGPKMESIVSGIAHGCRLADCVLAGGETAEHPDLMAADEYDLAGFVVGVVERDQRITGEQVSAGDVLIALPSSGVHSNGISLVRRLFLKDGIELPQDSAVRDFLHDEILLQPTIIYEQILRPLLIKPAIRAAIHGIAHITGGGFYENVPRILSPGLQARLDMHSYALPAVFERIQAQGVEHTEMHHVFNMGVGMILAVAARQVDLVLNELHSAWQAAKPDTAQLPWIIGSIAQSAGGPDVLIQ
ncbi:MAG: phosphoribosylformylglycinamidine cyclo-ligase [Leptospiraceae bacterium]|nr:phosphoribosylformylglycinamidine cyclo-ligase [Leptospiraceae bacterium]